MKRTLIFLVALAFCQASAQTKLDSNYISIPDSLMKSYRSYWGIVAIKEGKQDSIYFLGRPVMMIVYEKEYESREPTGKDYFVEAFIKFYSRYERDCWDDSTLIRGAMFRDWENGQEFWMRYFSRAGVMDTNLICLENRWIHRESTFESFIAWLRKQTQK